MNRHDHEGRAECCTRGVDQGGHVKYATDGRRGNSMGEMHQIADETSRSGERKISTFRLVHPCTSRGLRRARAKRLRTTGVLGGTLLDAGNSNPDGRSEDYKKSRGGGRRSLQERVAERIGLPGNRGTDSQSRLRLRTMTQAGMDFPECLAYAIIAVDLMAMRFEYEKARATCRWSRPSTRASSCTYCRP